MSELKRFGIYHPVGGNINTECNTDVAYEFVTAVEAENVVKSFYKAQVKFNPEYEKLGRRDTSTGDLITSNRRVFMYDGNGKFKRISTTQPLYKAIMDTDEAIIEILSRRHLTQEDIDELINNCY